MSSRRREVPPTKLRRPDEIDELFGRANPNPTREGCPGKDVLIALSRKERPISDPAYVHLTRCSPCYLEVRAFQEARTQERWRWLLTSAAAAAGVLAIVTAGWFFLPGSTSRSTDVRAEFDLRPYALTGSAPQIANRQPLTLPRGRVTLALLLPKASEPGAYEVQILDSALGSRASAPGTAAIKDHVTTLETTLELGSMMTGNYQLAIRRSGQDWQLFPARVR